MAIDLSCIDERPAALLRQGVELLATDLKKKKEQLEKLEVLEYSTRQLDTDIDLCQELDRLLDDQGDIVAESKLERRETPDPTNPQMSIDDALEGVEDEAAANIRRRRIRAALDEILPLVEAGTEITAAEARKLIATKLDAIEFIDIDGDKGEQRWPGVHKLYFNDQDGTGVVWCGVSVLSGAEGEERVAFYFDIMPDRFEPGLIMPTVRDEKLVAAFYEIRGAVDPDAIAAIAEQETELSERFYQRTRPAPATWDDPESQLREGLHTALFYARNGNPELAKHFWRGVVAQEVSDEELGKLLQVHFQTALGQKFDFSISLLTEEPLKYVTIHGTSDPVALWINKLDERVASLTGDELVSAVREMLWAADYDGPVETDYEIVCGGRCENAEVVDGKCSVCEYPVLPLAEPDQEPQSAETPEPAEA